MRTYAEQRKVLEGEAKKIKSDIHQLVADFHTRLADLADHRLAVERTIDAAELEAVLLLQASNASTFVPVKPALYIYLLDAAELEAAPGKEKKMKLRVYEALRALKASYTSSS